MKREFDKEILTITFKKIESFDEMLQTPTNMICYSKDDSGFPLYDTGFIKKKYTWIHKHPYYEILDCLWCGNSVNRETFLTSPYTFYKKVIKYKYKGKIFHSLNEYYEYVSKENNKNI